MLVLPNADRLWIDLYQFGQRIHQATTYRYSTTYGNVVLRELLAGNGRCRVDGCPILAHHKHLNIAGEADALHESLGFAAGGAVTNGDGLYLVHLNERLHLLHGGHSLVLGLMRVDGLVVDQVALSVEANQLAARSKTWI